MCTYRQAPRRPSKGTPLHQATCTPLAITATPFPQVTPSARLPLPNPPMGSHLLARRTMTKHPLVSHLSVSRPLVSHWITSHPLANHQRGSCLLGSPLWGSPLLGSPLLGSPLLDRLLRCHSSRHPVKGAVPAITPLPQQQEALADLLSRQVCSMSQYILVNIGWMGLGLL